MGPAPVMPLGAAQVMEYMPHLSFDADAVIHICNADHEVPDAGPIDPEDGRLMTRDMDGNGMTPWWLGDVWVHRYSFDVGFFLELCCVPLSWFVDYESVPIRRMDGTFASTYRYHDPNDTQLAQIWTFAAQKCCMGHSWWNILFTLWCFNRTNTQLLKVTVVHGPAMFHGSRDWKQDGYSVSIETLKNSCVIRAWLWGDGMGWTVAEDKKQLPNATRNSHLRKDWLKKSV